MRRILLFKGLILPWLIPIGVSFSLLALAEPQAHSPQRSRGYIALRYGRAFFTDREIVRGFEMADGSGIELFTASLGFNFGRYLGLELAGDFYEGDVEAGGGKIGEYTVYNLIPQLRLRYPLLGSSLTPYVLAGVGVGVSESSDPTSFGVSGAVPHFGGSDTALIYAVGGGLEYFIADNIAVGLEAKYVDHSADVEVNGATTEADLDAFLVSAGLRLFFPGPPKTAVAGTPSAPWWAFDPKEFRPYLALRVGLTILPDNQIQPRFVFGEHERSQVASLLLGFNLSRYLGIEIAVDQYGSDVEAIPQGKVGEYDVWNFIPQLRARYPLMNDKLVPYLVAGVGASLTRNNDGAPLADADPSLRFHADDWSVAGAIGAGVEYFVAYNMAVGIESRYIFTHPEVQIGGMSADFDLDSILLTVGLRIFYP